VRGFRNREFDAEGRYVEARFGKLWVVSLYMPSGSAGPAPPGVEAALPQALSPRT
jgi:exonuclease III